MNGTRSVTRARLRDRSGLVLAGATGLLLGALMMNLTSPPGVQVVDGSGRGVAAGGGASGDRSGVEIGEDGLPVDGAAAGGPGSSGNGAGGVESAGVGGSGAGVEGSRSGAASGSGPGAAATGGTAARGVTPTTVKVGFTFFNVGAYGVVPAYDVGPGPEKMAAVQERWRREGRDVVHGRKIELVYTEFSITDEASQRSACLSLVEDAKVFAVAAPAGVYSGTDCITTEKKTPLVQTASTGGSAQAVRDRAPWFFMVAPDRSQTSRNWAHWAHDRGLLKGKRIGFYYSAEEKGELEANFIAELRKLGYGDNIVAEVVAGDDEEVGPEDTVAVNRFRSENVDLAILLLNGLRMENFMQQAESLAYRPQYIASDLGVNTDDTKTTTFPPGQWDKTFAMSSMLYGQRGAPLPREAQICIDDYAKQGRRPQPGTAEFNYALMGCHALELVWQALDNAGPSLTVDSYIRGMEAISGYAGAFSPRTTFGPGDHTGSDLQRTLQWSASCRCWQRVSDFEPFPLR